MGNKIVTEADRRRTPAAPATANHTPIKSGQGQRLSQERGVATRNKKNPGTRARQGG